MATLNGRTFIGLCLLACIPWSSPLEIPIAKALGYCFGRDHDAKVVVSAFIPALYRRSLNSLDEFQALKHDEKKDLHNLMKIFPGSYKTAMGTVVKHGGNVPEHFNVDLLIRGFVDEWKYKDDQHCDGESDDQSLTCSPSQKNAVYVFETDSAEYSDSVIADDPRCTNPDGSPFCKNNGECTCSRFGGCKCKCTDEFVGKNCEIPSCDTTPCQNGGTCTAGLCVCPEEFSGNQCEISNPCFPNPCENSGTCSGDGICTCKAGFEGDRCEIDTCIPNPCMNSGTCAAGKCTCPVEFIGDKCEIPNPCFPEPCKNGGTCSEADGTYTCTCKPGFLGDQCQIDTCIPNPCKNNGTCAAGICSCHEAFRGEKCTVPKECSIDLDNMFNPIKEQLVCVATYILSVNVPGGLIPKPDIPTIKIKPWALKMLDASFKPPAGLAEGKLHWPGSYDQCWGTNTQYNTSYNLAVDEQADRNIQGRYCKVDIVPSNESSLPAIALGLGICLPDSCTTLDTLDNLNDKYYTIGFLDRFNLEIKQMFCGHDLDLGSDSRALLIVFITIILGIIAAAATVYDYGFRKSRLKQALEKSKGLAYLESPPSTSERLEVAFVGFSVYSSMKAVFSPQHQPYYYFKSCDAIRVLSFLYGVTGMTYVLGIVYTDTFLVGNITKLLELKKLLWFQPVINFTYCLDSFLVLSGFFVTFNWLQRVEKNGFKVKLIDMVYFYVHRYWKLMPAFMLCLTFYTCLYRYFTQGPMVPPEITDAENCRTNWWPNLLMISNLVNTKNACLSWTWFIPMLFQLHIITPLILVPLALRPNWGYVSLATFFFIHLVITAIKSAKLYDNTSESPGEAFDEWYYEFAMVPWTKAGAYFIGILLGKVMYDIRGKQINLHPLVSLIGWGCAIGMISAGAFHSHSIFNIQNPEGGFQLDALIDRWGKTEAVCVRLFCHTVWGLGVAWMIFCTETGNSGFVGSILKYPLWGPISRAVFVGFLMSAIMIIRNTLLQISLLYITANNMFVYAIGNAFIALALGFTLSLVYQRPFMGIDKAFSMTTRREAFLVARSPLDDEEDIDDNPTMEVIQRPRVGTGAAVSFSNPNYVAPSETHSEVISSEDPPPYTAYPQSTTMNKELYPQLN